MIDVTVAQGYGRTTLSAVLDHASIGEEDFYRHFHDLEDCFCTVLEEMRDEFLARVGGAVLAQESWHEQLHAAALSMFYFFLEDIKRARMMLVEVYAAGNRAQLIRDQGMDAMAALIDQGRYQLADPDSITRATAEGIAGTIYHRMHVGVLRGDPQELSKMFPDLMYTAVLPYLGTDVAMEELQREPPPLPPNTAHSLALEAPLGLGRSSGRLRK